MKISWIKNENDDRNFRIAEKLGMNVYKLSEPEQIDDKIAQLVQQNYNTIVISNEMASFSEDIIKKYKNNENINIIISPRK